MLKIKSGDRVLEIGSGNRPRGRSNVLCDRFLDDNIHRGTAADLVLDGRPFIVADGMALPFNDKAFDYVVLSHVLEHVEDPQMFVAELERVAKAGYIESPSELGEKIFGWQFHTWISRIEGDTLVLRRRTEDSPFGDYFHTMYKADPLFAEFVDSHFSDFYIQYEWSGKVKLRIEEDSSRHIKFSTNHAIVDTNSGFGSTAVAGVRPFLKPILLLLHHFRKVK